MKVSRPQLERGLKAPAELRFFLFHGPDEAGSRALAKSIAETMGKDAERVELTGGDLRADPARLADEAASISMFGEKRYIVVDPAGDEVIAAVEGLAQAAVAGNPVVLVAGALRPTSKLLKLALAEREAMAFASYAPEGVAGDKLVTDLCRTYGLSVRPDVARRIADGANGNRALIQQELEKFALFLDAAPDRQQPLEHDTLDALGVASEDGDLDRLVRAVAGGDPEALAAELDRLASEGIAGIPLLRAMLRRMALLGKLRAEVDRGSSVSAVMASQGKRLFWKDEKPIAGELTRWQSDLIAKAVERLAEAERQVKSPGSVGEILADEELFSISRQAARVR